MNRPLSVEQLTYVEARLANERKSIVLAYVLWFFLGWFGGHNFYIGRSGRALVQLLLTLIGIATTFFFVGYVVFGVVGLWILIDAFLIPGAIRDDLDWKRDSLIADMASGRMDGWTRR